MIELGSAVWESAGIGANHEVRGGVVIDVWTLPNEDGEPITTYAVLGTLGGAPREWTLTEDQIEPGMTVPPNPYSWGGHVRRLAREIAKTRGSSLSKESLRHAKLICVMVRLIERHT